MERRTFIKRTGAFTSGGLVFPTLTFDNNEDQIKKWLTMMEDPVRQSFYKKPTLDYILSLFPRQHGQPAFAPSEIQENLKKIKTSPEINTGHPFLDYSIKIGLAHIDATFEGDHPKYGTIYYGRMEHDGFPPTIIAVVDALSSWGMNARATELFRYWIINFVNNTDRWPNPSRKAGEINYFGPSISEYGQILDTAAILYERAGKSNWLDACFAQLNLLAEYVLQLLSEALKDDGLISGIPEADTRKDSGKYFHNNAWVVKGLKQWGKLCENAKVIPTTSLPVISKSADRLKTNTLSAIKEVWPTDINAWWLPALKGSKEQPKTLTDGIEANYTNYRYWLELLSSDILPKEMANHIVNARLIGGGQFCGMTRFMTWLDDWTLTDYLYGLWRLGRKEDFLLSLYGHIAYHQCEGHLTAYEQFNYPGDPNGSKKTDYCLPSQLVAARAGRLINRKG